jgi:hypothetical protein
LEPSHKRYERKISRIKLNLLRRSVRFRKEPFQYDRTNLSLWVRDYYLNAAETGVTADVKKK